jgi:hypothetical protein
MTTDISKRDKSVLEADKTAAAEGREVVTWSMYYAQQIEVDTPRHSFRVTARMPIRDIKKIFKGVMK